MAPAVVDACSESAQTETHNGGPLKGATDRVKQNELKELELADQYGAPDVYVDGEEDTAWYHWTGSIYVKPLRFENRTGCYVIKLKTEPHAELGKHRHRGEVRAYTIKGNWGYHE
jgi:2,4'-dihydroxyacetophenone dioxygenase